MNGEWQHELFHFDQVYQKLSQQHPILVNYQEVLRNKMMQLQQFEWIPGQRSAKHVIM